MNSSGSSLLSDHETRQIELMFSGKGSEVFVCKCLANLYFTQQNSRGKMSWAEKDRELKATGVPVLLLDHGNSAARSVRKMNIILAERGTGFLLWKDTIDSFSRYTEVGRTFHTLRLSTNHSKQAGFSFDTQIGAMQLFKSLREMLSTLDRINFHQGFGTESDSNNYSTSNSQKGRTKKTRRNSQQNLKLRKSEISNPCAFTHVTSIKPQDLDTTGGLPHQAKAAGIFGFGGQDDAVLNTGHKKRSSHNNASRQHSNQVDQKGQSRRFEENTNNNSNINIIPTGNNRPYQQRHEFSNPLNTKTTTNTTTSTASPLSSPSSGVYSSTDEGGGGNTAGFACYSPERVAYT